MKGLIVSIQGYAQPTTDELAAIAIKNGASGIRTDRQIRVNAPVIGLKKFHGKQFYITTDREAISEVAVWADYVAIDSRRGNREIDLLYSHCHVKNIDIVADIEKIEDAENILSMCNGLNIKKPAYFATTFSSCDTDLICQIRQICDIPVIAEGGYSSLPEITAAKQNGAVALCIGAAMEMGNLSSIYNKTWEEIPC